jgi:hypothetical protein
LMIDAPRSQIQDLLADRINGVRFPATRK